MIYRLKAAIFIPSLRAATIKIKQGYTPSPGQNIFGHDFNRKAG
jgi:hypothetical protein